MRVSFLRSRDDAIAHIAEPSGGTVAGAEAEGGGSNGTQEYLQSITPPLWADSIPWVVTVWTGATALEKYSPLPEAPLMWAWVLLMSAGFTLLVAGRRTYKQLQAEFKLAVPSAAKRHRQLKAAAKNTRVHIRSKLLMAAALLSLVGSLAGYGYTLRMDPVELPALLDEMTLADIESMGLIQVQYNEAKGELDLRLIPAMASPSTSCARATKEGAFPPASWSIRFTPSDMHFWMREGNEWKATDVVPATPAATKLGYPSAYRTYTTKSYVPWRQLRPWLRLAAPSVQPGESPKDVRDRVMHALVQVGVTITSRCIRHGYEPLPVLSVEDRDFNAKAKQRVRVEL